jgi:predicted PurR-regulated permease PerM
MNLTKLFLFLIILAVVVAGIMFYSWVFKYLIGAVIFTYIFNPSVCWLERRRIPRILGILIVYSVIGTFIAWSAIMVLPILIDQAQNLFEFIKTNSEQGEISLLKVSFVQTLLSYIDYLDSQVPILKLHDSFITIIKDLNHSVMNIPKIIVTNYQKILEAISLIATIPLIGFFLLKDNVKFRKDILKSIPNRYFELSLLIIHRIDEIVGRYLRAMFFEILIVGSLAAIAFSILGIEYAILIGFLAGLANVIPYFGPIMGVFFAVVSILIAGNPPVLILYVILAMYLIQLVDNNFVYPVVVGKSIEMHPLIVLLTVLAGGWAWGLVGMLVSVPIVFLIYGVTRILYVNLKEFKMI